MASLFRASAFTLILQSSLFSSASSLPGATFIPLPTTVHLRHAASEFEFEARAAAASAAIMTRSTSTTTSTLMKMNNKKYSAEWIDLLSPNSYRSPATSSTPSMTPSTYTLPGRIYPPRSSGISFTTPDLSKVFSFAGYAEVFDASTSSSSSSSPTVDRFVVNDLWEFVPYDETSNAKEWGWRKVLQNVQVDYTPGPRLATALAVLSPVTSDEKTTWMTTPGRNDDTTSLPPRAVLLGGWDPRSPGTGGVILDDVSMLNMNTLEWSQCVDSSSNEKKIATIPGGPTSRHVAVSLSIHEGNKRGNVICLHNHRCEDLVLLLSTVDEIDTAAGTVGKERCAAVEWKRQPTSGEAPSSRGLHCAATIRNSQTMVVFGGAAKDGNMSNESFILDTKTWKWTKLDCSGTNQHLPRPRAGACLCTLDNDTVLLFGGAMPSSDGLVGLNDVWILNVDSERGIGRWECLIENTDDDNDDHRRGGALRPPGRNAATLCPIDAKKLLPRNVIREKDVKDSSYFLLNGGWYPFRKTYDDVFILCISKKSII